jgi:hypothetical protein
VDKMAIIEYFSHDYRARFDPKMRKLFMEKGVAGIGIYWCLIEMLYENDGKLNVDNFETIAFDLRIEIEILQEIVNNFDLFIVDNSILTNNGVKKRLLIREQKAEKNRKNGKKGGRPPQNSPKKTENKPTAIPTVSENNPTVSENNQNKKKDD